MKQLALILLIFTAAEATKKPNIKDGRVGIVYLFEWSYRDIKLECDFLSAAGYGAVLVAPVSEGTVTKWHEWWNRFAPVSLKIASRSGTEEEFKDMVEYCNSKDLRVYVEVIVNHMGGQSGEVTGYAGSKAIAKEMSYPAVPFTATDFKPKCYSYTIRNATAMRNCIHNGPDLNWDSKNVQEKMGEFFNKLIDYGVAGFRLQACKYLWPSEIEIMLKLMKPLNTKFGFKEGEEPYIMCELKELKTEAVSKLEYNGLSMVSEHTYAEELSAVLKHETALAQLIKLKTNKKHLPSSDASVFLDNYEDQHLDWRSNVITFKQPREYKTGSAFMFAYPYGLPEIFSSYRFTNKYAGPPSDSDYNLLSPAPDANGECKDNWVCEHRWPEILGMVEFATVVGKSRLWNWGTNGQGQIAFCRGDLGFIAINSELRLNMNINMKACVPPGIYCDVITGGKKNGKCVGKQIEVDESGKARISIPYDSETPVIAIHDKSRL